MTAQDLKKDMIADRFEIHRSVLLLQEDSQQFVETIFSNLQKHVMMEIL